MDINITINNTYINQLLDDYKENNDIFSEEDPRVTLLKHIINNNLTDVEKRLIILYIDSQSFRKLAKELNISTSTCYNYINNIKKKILITYAGKTH